MNDNNIYVYALLLECNKYYIGKTTNISQRWESHVEQKGSEWTKLFPPIKILKIYNKCDSFDETKYTIMYMSLYGINNVRGGAFCSINLSTEQINIIKLMITSAADKCFKCGSPSHFIKDCDVSYNDHIMPNENNIAIDINNSHQITTRNTVYTASNKLNSYKSDKNDSTVLSYGTYKGSYNIDIETLSILLIQNKEKS